MTNVPLNGLLAAIIFLNPDYKHDDEPPNELFSVLFRCSSVACDLFLCYCIAFVRRFSNRFARIEIQQGF